MTDPEYNEPVEIPAGPETDTGETPVHTEPPTPPVVHTPPPLLPPSDDEIS